MFDAKSILEQLAGSAGRQTAGSTGGGGLGDILGQIAGQIGQGGKGGLPGGLDEIIRNITSGQGSGQPGGTDAGQGGGLADILGKIQEQMGGAGTGGQAGTSGAGTGGLGDILGKIQEQMGGSGAQGGQGGGGSLLDTLGQVLAQATEGAKEGAGRIGDATGAGKALQDALGGRSPEEILAQLRELAANNQLATGAVLGGLGGILLGTRTGRSMVSGAAKVGALALIGGLAYKAYQNYQSGKPVLDSASGVAQVAPAGSGFEPDAVSNDTALLIIRTMIAAAAADGRIDDQERSRISGMLGANASAEARAFVTKELSDPASPMDIAGSVTSPAEAAQIYAAARIAIDPDSIGERQFLSQLATALRIDPALAQHIDASARGQA